LGYALYGRLPASDQAAQIMLKPELVPRKNLTEEISGFPDQLGKPIMSNIIESKASILINRKS